MVRPEPSEPGPGYYTDIPDGEQMLNVRVGADWSLETMKAAGFRTKRYLVDDPAAQIYGATSRYRRFAGSGAARLLT